MPELNPNPTSENNPQENITPAGKYRRLHRVALRFDLALRNRGQRLSDPRQLLLPLKEFFTAATRVAHALPRFISSKAKKFLRNLQSLHRLLHLRRTHPLDGWTHGTLRWR